MDELVCGCVFPLLLGVWPGADGWVPGQLRACDRGGSPGTGCSWTQQSPQVSWARRQCQAAGPPGNLRPSLLQMHLEVSFP